MNTIPLPAVEAPQDTSRIFDVSIKPLDRLRTVEAGEFEDIVCQWASGYLANSENYKNAAQMGGSKDSGRDIVAYLDDAMQTFDIFQCKRYKEPLSPSVYMSTSDNLEDIYMEMYERDDCEVQRIQLEEAIQKYFCEFKLPDEPTIYDLMLLSLTKKDLVATFNWDSLLVEAYTRCTRITTNLPQMAFLHGSIAVATCEKEFTALF